MKYIFLVLTLLPSVLLGAGVDCYRKWEYTARTSFFFPTDPIFQEIYGNWGIGGGGEIYRELCGHFGAFLGVDVLCRKGHTIGQKNFTELTLVPVSLGARYSLWLSCNSLVYAGLGPVFTHVSVYQDTDYAKTDHKDSGVGFFSRIGTKYRLYQCLALDLFVDYTWQKITFPGSKDPYVQGRKANLGHVKIGLGLTYFGR